MNARVELYRRLPQVATDGWWVEQALAAGGDVLELGAGTGRLTAAFLAAGCNVTAVEHDPAMLEVLREGFGDRVDVVAADVTDLPAGPSASFVALPTSLLNELPDAGARTAALHGAARRCAEDGTVGIHLLGPWWLAAMPDRASGRLQPVDDSAVIEVSVVAGEFDPWAARRQAELTYRFPDGVVLHDHLDAAVVVPAELEAACVAAGLRLSERFGAVPPAPPRAHDPAWHLLARPTSLAA